MAATLKLVRSGWGIWRKKGSWACFRARSWGCSMESSAALIAPPRMGPVRDGHRDTGLAIPVCHARIHRQAFQAHGRHVQRPGPMHHDSQGHSPCHYASNMLLMLQCYKVLTTTTPCRVRHGCCYSRMSSRRRCKSCTCCSTSHPSSGCQGCQTCWTLRHASASGSRHWSKRNRL